MSSFIGNINELTIHNKFFRKILFTGKHEQLVIMNLNAGEEIGQEIHEDADQFFRIEQGEAKFIFNNKDVYNVKKDFALIVPAGTIHNVINNSKTNPLKFYTVYSTPKHTKKT